MRIDLHINLTCEHCGKQSPLDLKGANIHALKAALATIAAANRSKPAKGEQHPWADELLENIFQLVPFGTWFEVAQVPESKLTAYFTGANPRAQFGLWLTHQSRRPMKPGRWYVKRSKPDESAAEYLVGFALPDDWTPEHVPEAYLKKLDTFKQTENRI